MSDKYYDSLDEEEDSVSLRKSMSESIDISQMVPLYGRETAKIEIISTKPRNRAIKSNSILTRTKNELNSTSSGSLNHLFLDSNKKKSYVDLFHAKIGYVQGSEPTDTTRGVCDDEFKTARTSAGSLENSDAESVISAVSFVSDDSNFYIKFLENEKALANKLSSVSCRSTNPNSTYNQSTPTLVSLARSTQSVSKSGRCNVSKVTSKEKFDKSALRVPTLGGLGPDRESCKEKLEKLKLKQRYGQKVSNENRMKMMETKVMKNFKYELKKSCDLNKCADSVVLIS